MSCYEFLPFESRLAQAWPPEQWQSEGVLVAVSGGPDSVALLRALVRLGMDRPARLAAAHFNHRLRGAESDSDQCFVENLCRQCRVALEVGFPPAEGLAKGPHGGVEEAARRARYGFLARTATVLGLRYVATGHTADDQAETIVHRIVRGTGLAGLGGMAKARPLGQAVTLIRPLLGLRRRDALEYLERLGQSFRVDSSNLEPRWTRNRIRLDLLPRLAADYNPQIVEAVVRLGRLAREAHELVAAMVEPLYDRCVEAGAEGGVSVACESLATAPRYLVRELFITVWRRQGWPLREMGFEEWDALACLATGAGKANDRVGQDRAVHLFPGGVRAERRGSELRLTRRCSRTAACQPQE